MHLERYSDRYCVRALGIAILLLLVVSAVAHADVFLSVQNGAWSDATTWISTSGNPNAVPGPADDVIITRDVGMLADGEAGDPSVVVQSLWVTPFGILRARYPDVTFGRNMVITTTHYFDFSNFDASAPLDPNNLPDPAMIDIFLYSPFCSLYNQGRILGQNGGWAGGSVLIRSDAPLGGAPTPGLFVNAGEILGGAGRRYGGNVVALYPEGAAINFAWPVGLMAGADGSAFGGQALMISAHTYNGLPLLGGSIPGIMNAGQSGGGSGGAAFAAAFSAGYPRVAVAHNALGSAVHAGDGRTTVGNHYGGGQAGVLALEPSGLGLAVNEFAAQILGGLGCPGGNAWFFGDFTWNQGTVASGQTFCEPTRVRVDPTEGLLDGMTRITGDIIEIGADNLIIGPLLWGPEPPIEATERVEITVTNRLDLSNLPVGVVSIAAGTAIDIYAEEILIPAPIGPPILASTADELAPFMNMTPNWSPFTGRPYRQLFAGTNALYRVEPGESLELQGMLANVGSRVENVDCWVTCDRDGWMANWLGDPNVPINMTLQPIDGELEKVMINVPSDASPFERARVIMHIEPVGEPNRAEEATIDLVLLACLGRGDLDDDGDVDLSDLAIMLADFGCQQNCAGDITGDDQTNLSDLAILLSEYGCGS